MFYCLKIVLILFCSLAFQSVFATTAVNDVSVNYLTSFHVSGPEGWPNAGHPYYPPYYNEERDELIGTTSSFTSTLYGMRPSHSHYYRIPASEGISSYTGLVEDPVAGKLYLAMSKTLRDETTKAFYFVSEIVSFDLDGSNPEVVVAIDASPSLNTIKARPVFDNQQRMYLVDSDAAGLSRLMRKNVDNSLTVMHQFSLGPQGQSSIPSGIMYSSVDDIIYGLLAFKRGVPFQDALSTDDNFPVGILYKIDPNQANSFQVLHTFLLAHGELPWWSSVSADLIEHDGYLYGGTSVGKCNGLLCGGRYQRYSTSGKLLITSDLPHYDGSNPYGSLYRIKKDGSEFTLLHTFSGEDGSQPLGPMIISQDGYLYGTTLGGGVHKSELGSGPAIVGNPYPLDERNESPNGTIYRIKLSSIDIKNGVVNNSGFEHVHSFRAGIDENADGKSPTGLMLAENGRLYGTTLYGGRTYTEASGRSYQFDDKGTVFEVDLEGNLPGGSIVVSATPGSIGPGEEAVITWSGGDISNCLASGGSAQDDWANDEEVDVMGSMVVAPETGVYYYTMNCADDLKGGRVGALATLYVGAEPKAKSSTSLEYGNGAGHLSLNPLWLLFIVSYMGNRRFYQRYISITEDRG